jgi:hypothetical protein
MGANTSTTSPCWRVAPIEVGTQTPFTAASITLHPINCYKSGTNIISKAQAEGMFHGPPRVYDIVYHSSALTELATRT